MNTIKTEDKIEIKPGYKKTPVGIIPEDWEVKEINDFAEIKGRIGFRGYTKDDIVKEGKGAVSISPSNFKNGVLDITNATYISWFKYEESPEIKVEQGDVLLVKTGSTYGKTCFVQNLPLKSTINPQIIIIKKVQINKRFLGFLVSTSLFNKEIERIVVGGAIPTISQKEIAKIQLPIPPLPEQKAIADCLSTWDKGIEKLSALIASKKEQKKGLMQQLLTGKKRLDGFTEEWKEVRLGKYFKERNQRGFNDLDLLSIGEEGVYPQSDSNKKDTSNSDKSKYKLIEIGDLGYNTMRLWQGRIALSNIRGIVSPAYTILIPQTGKVNSNYYSYLFKMPFVVNKFYRNSQGMVSDTLTCRYNDFKKIKLFIPSIEEQAAITEVLTTADKEIELLEQKLASFKMQKKGLMQVLLTGEKRLIK